MSEEQCINKVKNFNKQKIKVPNRSHRAEEYSNQTKKFSRGIQ